MRGLALGVRLRGLYRIVLATEVRELRIMAGDLTLHELVDARDDFVVALTFSDGSDARQLGRTTRMLAQLLAELKLIGAVLHELGQFAAQRGAMLVGSLGRGALFLRRSCAPFRWLFGSVLSLSGYPRMRQRVHPRGSLVV